MSKINKIVTNYPVSLTNDEVENLSLTLSAVRTAGGGGGSEGKIYHGEGFVAVNNTSNAISLTTEANEKLNQPIPTKVSDLTDSASYQTVAGMSDYSTKTVADTLYAPISVTGDVDTLKSSSSDWDNVSAKLDTTAFSTVSGNFLTEVPAGYATETWVENKHYLTSVPDTYYTKFQTSGADQLAAAFDNILVYDVTAAAGIKITTATDDGKTTFGISMTAEPVVTDTNLSGYNGIAAAPDGAKSGWWNVGLTQDMLNTINNKLDSTDAAQTYLTTATYVADSATFLTKSSADNDYAPIRVTDDVDILKSSSADWLKESDLNNYALKSDIPTTVAQLSDSENYYKKTETSGKTEIANALSTKLDSTAAAQTYQTKSDMANYLTTSDASTAYQPIGNYASASDIVGMATQTWVGQQGFITKDANDLTYYYKKTETSGVSELSTEFAKYVTKPDSSLVNNYLVLRTDNAGNVSGWCDFNEQCYSKAEANRTFVATANIDTTTLSGNGKSSSTKLGVNTDVIATKDWLDDNYLPLSGGTVSGNVIVKSTGNNLLAVNTTATLMGQSRVNSLTDTTAIGTNWLGVNSYGGGFLKNVQGGNVGDLNGTSLQINFAPDGANSYGNITVESQGNQSKVVHVPTASYNSMSSFDNTNGPNYMLRKTASGFDIGAAVINVTSLPAQTEANTYYFIYDT